MKNRVIPALIIIIMGIALSGYFLLPWVYTTYFLPTSSFNQTLASDHSINLPISFTINLRANYTDNGVDKSPYNINLGFNDGKLDFVTEDWLLYSGSGLFCSSDQMNDTDFKACTNEGPLDRIPLTKEKLQELLSNGTIPQCSDGHITGHLCYTSIDVLTQYYEAIENQTGSYYDENGSLLGNCTAINNPYAHDLTTNYYNLKGEFIGSCGSYHGPGGSGGNGYCDNELVGRPFKKGSSHEGQLTDRYVCIIP